MKTVRKRKICMINGMKYNSKSKIIIAKHNDGKENHFCLSDNRSHTIRNEEFKKTIKLAKEMRGNKNEGEVRNEIRSNFEKIT